MTGLEYIGIGSLIVNIVHVPGILLYVIRLERRLVKIETLMESSRDHAT